jgi:uncharacterized protein YpmS
MKNEWKKGFFLLLGLNLLIVIIILCLFLIPPGKEEWVQQKKEEGNHVTFHVRSNKEDLNRLINQFVKKEAKDSPIDYEVHLRDEVELYGTIPFFSQQLNMKLTFEPEALENGDLILKQNSISIGSLDLPVAYVLKFIRDNYKLPKGVDIRPNEKLIYVNMEQLNIKSDIKVKANKFDLKNNDITFTILVPVE